MDGNSKLSFGFMLYLMFWLWPGGTLRLFSHCHQYLTSWTTCSRQWACFEFYTKFYCQGEHCMGILEISPPFYSESLSGKNIFVYLKVPSAVLDVLLCLCLCTFLSRNHHYVYKRHSSLPSMPLWLQMVARVDWEVNRLACLLPLWQDSPFWPAAKSQDQGCQTHGSHEN